MLEVRPVIQSAFQASQLNASNHRALSLNLKTAHSEALKNNQGEEFFQCFVKCLDRLLTASRKDQSANRVVDFVATYAKLICPEEEEQEQEGEGQDDGGNANDEFELFVQFVEAVIERYVPGFESRLAQVRHRCVSLVCTLVPLAPLNETLLAELEVKAIKRLKDADSKVRVQAVILVSRFDLSDATKHALAVAMQHDPSADVRLVATYNIAHGSKALTELACERVRDSGAQIRRGLYSKVLRTIDFRALSIKARETIVRSGVNDRDESVKRAACMLIANRWVNMSDNNIELVLQRLDVVGHTEIADLVLSAFFQMRRDVAERLEFGEEFWSELWIEDTVLLRGFQEFCLHEGLEEVFYDRVPDLTTLANEIDSLWKKYANPETYANAANEEEADDLRECLPFMVEQLLQVASRYDLDDEASRQRITAVINDIIMSENAPSNTTIEHIVTIQRRLNASDSALVSWAFETLEAMPSTSEASDQALITTILRALALFNAVLAKVSSHDVAAYLPSLYTTYIEPATRSPFPEIRAPALRCLGLACLLDERFASEHMSEFANFITSSGQRLMAAPNADEAEAEDSTKEFVISINAMTDMLLVHVDKELPSEAIAKLWVSLLRSENSAIQGAAALSLAKIVLASLLEDPQQQQDVLTRLVIFYFENTAGIEDDETRALTQQQLNMFLRCYCLFDEGKEGLVSVFPELYNHFVAYKSKVKTRITLGDLLSQLLELTAGSGESPRRSDETAAAMVDTATTIEADEPETWHHAHAQIAFDIVGLLFDSEDVNTRRSLGASLGKVVLKNAPLIALQRINALLESRGGDLTEISPAGIRNSVVNFKELLNQQISRSVIDEVALQASAAAANEQQQQPEPASVAA